MTITALHRRRGRLYLLEIDGEPAVTVDMRTFDESPYREGSTIDDEELHALLEASARRRAREKALWLLSARDYAAAELAEKLKKDAGAQIAAETVTLLQEQGLIREEAYARRLADELCLRRHYPQRRAVQELVRRGIDRELAQEAVAQIDSDDLKEALALLEKKRYTDTDKGALYRKVTGFLARQGYDYSTVRRVWAKWSEEHTADFDIGDGGYDDEL